MMLNWLVVFTFLAAWIIGGFSISGHEAYRNRLEIQSKRPSSGNGLSHQELRREKKLINKFRTFSKLSWENDSLPSIVREFCHSEVDGGCSWMEANKLLFEFQNPRRVDGMDMVREWVLPTTVLKQAMPTELNSKCTELTSFPTGLEFIRDYVSKGVPFIVKGALVDQWDAVGKWDLEYLNETLGGEEVKLYISLDGDFEKVQSAGEWAQTIDGLAEVVGGESPNPKNHPLPDEPILIRPAETLFTFAQYTYLSLFYPNEEQASFYLQKHDLRLWKDFTNIMQDISPFLFGERAKSAQQTEDLYKKKSKSKTKRTSKSKTKRTSKSKKSGRELGVNVDVEVNGFGFSNFLQLQYFLVWIGMGDTRGPVHFDENENIFAMVKGRKTWTMFHPSESKQMYESGAEFRSGHLLFEIDLSDVDISGGNTHSNVTPEGEYFTLPVSSTDKSYQPFSPVNVTHPDYVKHPAFREAHKVVCELDAGDVLYLPSNWWHEVASEGDPEDGMSIGEFLHLPSHSTLCC